MEGSYTDCTALRGEPKSRSWQPRNTILKSIKNANPGIVNDTLACSADRKNPDCAKVRKTTTDRVTTTNRILSHAQQQNFRSFESAVNRSATKRVMYDQAVCSKLTLQANTLP